MEYITEDVSFDNLPPVSESGVNYEFEVISVMMDEGVRRASMTLKEYDKDCELELFLETDGLFILMDKTALEFRQQDEELQKAILNSMRSGDFAVMEGFCCC